MRAVCMFRTGPGLSRRTSHTMPVKRAGGLGIMATMILLTSCDGWMIEKREMEERVFCV